MTQPIISKEECRKAFMEKYPSIEEFQQATSMKLKSIEGKKDDSGKLRYDLISPIGLEELAKVYTFGASKYEDENWRKGISFKRIFAAIMRHSWAWMRGEDFDVCKIDCPKDCKEHSGLHHMAHAAWGCFTLIEYSITRKDFDDRYKLPKM